MRIHKQQSGAYAATLRLADGKSASIDLHSNSRREAEAVAGEARLREIELVARSGLVRRELMARIVLERKSRCQDALAEWEQWLLARFTAKHTLNLTVAVSAFLRDSLLGETFAHDVTPAQVDGWINQAGSETKASTRKLKLCAIRKFFEFCSRSHCVVDNPAADLRVSMAVLRHEQKEARTGRPFTEQEYERLCSLCESRRLTFWKCAVMTGWQTGLRLGDICQLQWASLKEPLRIVVWTGKTDTRVTLPIKPGLSAVLRSLPRTDPVWVFPKQQAIYACAGRRARFSVEFSRLLKAAGISGHCFHDLRHSALTSIVEKSGSLLVGAKMAGHASTAMTERYFHPELTAPVVPRNRLP